MAAAEDVDYYSILNVSSTATLQEIKTAYRQQSLKVHPDRNPDNPDAAALFHTLRLAADILIDPIQRSTFDTLLLARNARAERFKGLNNKRKTLAEDLQRREMEFKRSRGELDKKGMQERNELDRLREEGKKLREGKDKVIREELGRDEEVERIKKSDLEKKRKKEEDAKNSGIVELGPLDLMLKLKFTRSLYPTLISTELVLAHLTQLFNSNSTTSNNSNLMKEIDTLLLSPKFLLNPTKGKSGSGMISFKSLSGIAKFMEFVKLESGSGSNKNWEGIEINWAGGEAPAILGLTKGKKEVEREVSSFPTSMLVDGDEDRILALLRAKERAKLIADLEREEAEAEQQGL